MIIDAHHHFWKYDPVHYDWITEEMKIIRKDFLASDLKKTIERARVDGVISVQARQSLEETDWLLQLASENDFIHGVVGWLPLADDKIGEMLQKYTQRNNLKAIRHVVQGEPDPGFILSRKFNQGISLLEKYGLTYDILIFEEQLPNTIRFVDQHPNQLFVLDHIAKPKIKNKVLEPWKKNIRALAKRENVFCKLSGLVTEAGYQDWTESQLNTYLDHVLDIFGPERLMFGSDWPVCLVAVDYTKWLELIKNFISKLSKNEQHMILCDNAVKCYNLKGIK